MQAHGDTFIGIDVGADRLHVASLDGSARVGAVALFSAAEVPELVAWVDGADVVAVDAPAQLSASPHADDVALSPKFRAARCAEIALGRQFGSWVPFVAPSSRPATAWMETGFDLYEALHQQSGAVIEVFPFAGYRLLAGRRPAKKSTVQGLTERVGLLRRAGVSGAQLQMWSHDSLDALLGALVALHHAKGIAAKVSCGHDDSAIWLPSTTSTTM